MKLASYSIIEALEADDLLAAANLIAVHFGLPEMALLPGLRIYSSKDGYCILLLGGDDCYEWSKEKGFSRTRYGMPCNDEDRSTVISRVVVWR